MSKKYYVRIERGSGNTLFQGVAIVLGLIALMAAVIVGGFLLAALIAVGLIGWLAIYVRLWWLTRKMRKEGGQAVPDAQGEVVEAEYTIIETLDRANDSGNDSGNDRGGRDG
jgi:membrane protein implicated in regulation of membrane protease activity